MMLRRAVVARRNLEDVEEALARLAAGRFGRCEQCDSPIPGGLLALKCLAAREPVRTGGAAVRCVTSP